jgi:Transposon-encoded protein TnpV
LQESRPNVLGKLRQSGNLDSYLCSVGEQAAEMYSDIMAKYMHSPEVQKLPHLARVRAIESRQPEAEEIVRNDIINQPLPED